MPLKTSGAAGFNAVGHRVVHGGPRHHKPERVNNAMLSDLRSMSAFDPEHPPAEIALMECLARKFPTRRRSPVSTLRFTMACRVSQSCCPIPRRYKSRGVRLYGFHDLSYEYFVTQPVCRPVSSLLISAIARVSPRIVVSVRCIMIPFRGEPRRILASAKSGGVTSFQIPSAARQSLSARIESTIRILPVARARKGLRGK